MSVSGVNSIGPDLVTLVQLSSHGPVAGAAQAQGAAPVAATTAARPADAAQEISAQTALDEYIAGGAPTDESIGLYSGDTGASADLAADAEAVLASEIQATAVLQEQILSQAIETDDTTAAQLQTERQIQIDQEVVIDRRPDLTAVADIDRSLTEALTEAKLTAIVTNLQSLSEVADLGEAAAAVTRLQSNLANLSEPELNQLFKAGPASPQSGQPALPAQFQSLVALAQSGDVAGATAAARAIQAQFSPPSEADLQSLMATLSPNVLSVLDLDMNPLLLAFQLSMLIRAKTTIESLRRLRQDHVAILPILPLDLLETHDDKNRADD